MENNYRTMELHYDVTMESIMMSEVIIISIIVQLGVFLHFDLKI